MSQIYDAGEVFGIMNYEQGESDDEDEKKADTVGAICSKVVVTRDSGLQASDASRLEATKIYFFTLPESLKTIEQFQTGICTCMAVVLTTWILFGYQRLKTESAAV